MPTNLNLINMHSWKLHSLREKVLVCMYVCAGVFAWSAKSEGSYYTIHQRRLCLRAFGHLSVCARVFWIEHNPISPAANKCKSH